MAAHAMNPNTNDLPRLAASSRDDLGATGNRDTADPVTSFKSEEVVAVIPQSGAENGGGEGAGYLIYTLSESTDPAAASEGSESGARFRLRAVPYSPSQHPRHLTAALSPLTLRRTALPPHLAPRGRRRIHVLVFKGAGLRLASEFCSGVLRPLLEAAGVVPDEVAELDGAQAVSAAVRRLAREAREASASGGTEATVVLLSGDGGLVELLSALDREAERDQETGGSSGGGGSAGGRRAPPTVVLFPLGTGNALFHSLHKPLYEAHGAPSPFVLALRSLFFGTAVPLPTFRASFSSGARLAAAPGGGEGEGEHDGPAPPEEQHPVRHLVGAVVASYGFHASLVWASDTPEHRVHGDKRFGMAAAELLHEAHAYDAEVQVRWKGAEGFAPLRIPPVDDENKDETSRQRLAYLLLALVSNLEKTFTISPASRPLDGVLRGVWFGALDGKRTMDIMTKAYQRGAHVEMPEVGYTGDGSPELDEVRVVVREEEARWRKICVDGTIVEVEKDGWVVVKREDKGREMLNVVVNGAVLSRR
ncbi:hypothetical protein VTJ83DRAFT_4229 [Remersonia thermophila]|uniref:DAGKc domain-containing protein n=1 Tax=Remersonia thermophila TaxID=72144 RepID=A0ABR4D9K2_9PEZI